MTPEMFRKLAALDLSHEQMAGVLEIIESDAETRRSKARTRVQKWRQKRAAEEKSVTSQNITNHNVTEGNETSGLARVEGSSNNLDTSGKKNTHASRDASDVTAFKAELQELDDERLNALIKHRRSKRGAITGHAAKLFVRDANDCGLSLAAAVDTCISRNWITVKPEYFAPRRPNGQGPPHVNGYTETPLTTGKVSRLEDVIEEWQQRHERDGKTGGIPGG